MRNFKKLSKCALALFLALTMCAGVMSLTAFAEESDGTALVGDKKPAPLPELEENPTDPAAEDLKDPYKEVFEEANGAREDVLAEETGTLAEVNGEISAIESDTNQAIEDLNAALEEEVSRQEELLSQANQAGETAASQAGEQVQIATDALAAASDESATLEEREAAAQAAEAAAEEAASRAQEADRAYDAAEQAVQTAEAAVSEAEAEFQRLTAEAEGAVGEQKRILAEAIADAQEKLTDAREKLEKTQDQRDQLESDRSAAWSGAETARLAAEAARASADAYEGAGATGAGKVISAVTEACGDGIATADREELETKVGEAIRNDTALTDAAKTEEKARDVVDAMGKQEDLAAIKALKEAQTELESANTVLSTAITETKAAKQAAKDTKDHGIPGPLEGAAEANTWLDHLYTFKDGTTTGPLGNEYPHYTSISRRDIINFILGDHGDGEYPEGLRDPANYEMLVAKVLEDAKNPGLADWIPTQKNAKDFIQGIGSTIEAWRDKQAGQEAAQQTFDDKLAAANAAAGLTGSSAMETYQDMVDALTQQIQDRNPDDKYGLGEDLESLSGKLAEADKALEAAKRAYQEAYKKSNSGAEAKEIQTLDQAKSALDAAGEAVGSAQASYEEALGALNTMLESDKLNADERQATLALLNTLVDQKKIVDTAQRLLNDALQKEDFADQKSDEYEDARKASQKAHSDYLTAQRAVEEAQEALANAEANEASFDTLTDLRDRLEAARRELAEASVIRRTATGAEEAARQAAEEAREAADRARELAEEVIEDLPGLDEDPGFDSGDSESEEAGESEEAEAGLEALTIEDGEVPLAGLISRGELVNYLYTREGSPEAALSTFPDVPAEHVYAMAIGWAQANGIVVGYADESFRPDDAVTLGVLRSVLTRYAGFKGIRFSLTLEGADGDVVMTADEILKEFFQE